MKKKLHKLIIEYIRGPTNTKLICLLIDSRRGGFLIIYSALIRSGIQEGDVDLMKSLDESHRTYMVRAMSVLKPMPLDRSYESGQTNGV